MKLPWQIVEPLDARLFAEVRHAAIFECCKWDPQVEDVCTLSPLPLVLTSEAWQELASLAKKMAQEAVAAEMAILHRPHLLKKLGLPWTLRRKLSAPEIATGQPRHQRLIRFDFHFTTEGWRISEANSDVPGGFNEASGFTRLMARHYGQAVTSGDPTEKMAAAIGKVAGRSCTVALVRCRVSAHQFHRVPVFLAFLRIEREPSKPFHFARQIGKLFGVCSLWKLAASVGIAQMWQSAIISAIYSRSGHNYSHISLQSW